jgi:hypothetical protein
MRAMNDLLKLFSSDNFTMSSSWIETLYCSFEDDGTILIIEHKSGDGAEEWYETDVDVSKPADFIEAIDRLENIAFDCINTVISSLEDNNHEFASVLKEELLLQEALEEPLKTKPTMSPDSSEPTKSFVVPDHLIAGVAELKEAYPDASDEDLANRLKYW